MIESNGALQERIDRPENFQRCTRQSHCLGCHVPPWFPANAMLPFTLLCRTDQFSSVQYLGSCPVPQAGASEYRSTQQQELDSREGIDSARPNTRGTCPTKLITCTSPELPRDVLAELATCNPPDVTRSKAFTAFADFTDFNALMT